MAGGWHLAQVNVGRLAAPPDHAQVAGVFAARDHVNALADATPGFVWRIEGEGADVIDGVPPALWWVPLGDTPTIADASRSRMLDRHGPSAQAFTFKALHPAPGLTGPPVDHQPDPWCVGRA